MAIDGTTSFIKYLSEELRLDEVEITAIRTWGRVGTTIGALSLSLNLLDMDKITNLLEEQEQSGGLFGDVAIKLGYLDAAQVKKLLNIQKWRRREDILNHLLLSSRINEDQYRELIPKVFFPNSLVK